MPSQLGERLWRIRKHYSWMDARMDDADGSAGVDIRVFLDGELVYSRLWPTRDLALADATDRLRERQRAGWSTHW
jgi:hypothetical protein